MSNTKRCPFCGEMIDNNATICPFCAEDIPKEETTTSNINCPYCGEEILPTAKKCKYCQSWLDSTDKSNNHSKSDNNKKDGVFNNLEQKVTSVIGLILFIVLLFWIFSSSTNNYTTNNWLKGCEESKEHLGNSGIGVYKEYKCKNKVYTDVLEASMVTLGLNPSYKVYDNNKLVGYIIYDYNFKQYHCAYVWNQDETTCNLPEFVSSLKKYEDYKNKNNKIQTDGAVVKPLNTPSKKTTPPTKSIRTDTITDNSDNNSSLTNITDKIKDKSTSTNHVIKSKQSEIVQQPMTAQELDWTLYKQKLARAIKGYWQPMTGTETWSVVLRFTILKDGTITNIKTVSHDGSVLVAEYAIDPLVMVSNDRNFSLPPEYKGDSIDMEVSFPSISLAIIDEQY